MSIESFFWHDYETFGADPRRDRPAQFAGQRTDMELRPIGEPIMAYCRPARDFLPQPGACLVTGITPQLADEKGLPEPEFAALIQEELARPGTCGVGYNSIRFDDEVTRFLLYRNFHDPYEREWKHGNSRWDLIDVARLCYALRPEGIEWPRHDDGSPSFRLEDLSAANGLEHGAAHDALSDVTATIALARLLRERKRRLFEWALSLRRKPAVRSLIDVASMQPLVHVSSKYPADRGCLALVAPICAHPVNSNGVIVYDLARDPKDLAELTPEQLAARIFTRQEDLAEGLDRIPLKTVHLNRSPMLAPLGVLKGVDTARIRLHVEVCLEHQRSLTAIEGLAETIRRAFAPSSEMEIPDADEALYAGFAPDSDRALFPEVRSARPSSLASLEERFHDPRYRELLFRYRARNHPEALDPVERERWLGLLRARLLESDGDAESGWDQLRREIEALRSEVEPSQRDILDAVEAWGRARVEELGTWADG